MEYRVYIAYNGAFDKFYIGQTNNIARRECEHTEGLSEYTSKFKGGWKILYTETFATRSEAMKREKFLKKQKNKSFYRKLCGCVSSIG